MLDLHFWPTPNGKKVTILLEELGLDYNLVPCNIGRGDTACRRWSITTRRAAARRSASSSLGRS